MKTILVLLTGLLILTQSVLQAQINYQGRLTDATGAALDPGPTTLTFSLWTAATGGSSFWGPYILDGGTATGHGPQADVVADGRFNVIIGATDTTGRSLTTQLGTSTTAYLQIQVGSSAPISPRQIILAAPRALIADVIPNVTPVGSGVTIPGNVGIGTTNNTYKLDVNGTARVTGNATFASATITGNGTGSVHFNANGKTGGGLWWNLHSGGQPVTQVCIEYYASPGELPTIEPFRLSIDGTKWSVVTL